MLPTPGHTAGTGALQRRKVLIKIPVKMTLFSSYVRPYTQARPMDTAGAQQNAVIP
jgi:hypothetical protein